MEVLSPFALLFNTKSSMRKSSGYAAKSIKYVIYTKPEPQLTCFERSWEVDLKSTFLLGHKQKSNMGSHCRAINLFVKLNNELVGGAMHIHLRSFSSDFA